MLGRSEVKFMGSSKQRPHADARRPGPSPSVNTRVKRCRKSARRIPFRTTISGRFRRRYSSYGAKRFHGYYTVGSVTPQLPTNLFAETRGLNLGTQFQGGTRGGR